MSAGEFDVALDDMSVMLQQLGYTSDMQEVLSQFEAASQADIGFWSGNYALFDETGGAYSLVINKTRAELSAGSTRLTEHSFDNGVLRFPGLKMSVELTMALPAAPGIALEPNLLVKLRQAQPRCNGSVTITTDAGTNKYEIRGKRGCYTLEGVTREVDGDPPATWAGAYLVIYTDVDPSEQAGDKLVVTQEAGGLAIAFGQMNGTGLEFCDNMLRGQLGAGGPELMVRFEMSAGRHKRFSGLLRAAGKVRSFTGDLSS